MGWVVAGGLVVALGEGAAEEGFAAGFVELRPGVGGALYQLRAQVRPVFVVAEEGLEVGDGAEF